MRIILLILAFLGCPIAYLALVYRMRNQRIENPSNLPMFFLCGTIGGWMLAYALSPSGLAAMCMMFLMTASPLAMFIASVRIRPIMNKSIYHRVTMWSGLLYPAVLAGCIAFVSCLAGLQS